MAGNQGIALDCIIADHVVVLQNFEVLHTVVVDAIELFWDLHTFEVEEEKMFISDNIIEGNFVWGDTRFQESKMKASKDSVIIAVS